ncbi:MAG: 4-hydroxy-tetrahydrodipicolinate synthase [Bacteroidota bacterium]
MNSLRGTGVALITPFTENRDIDFPALRYVSKFILDQGVDYLVVMGTTGEAATLSEEEQEAVISTVMNTVDGQAPIVIGIGGNNTHSVSSRIQKWESAYSPAAILSVSPYYNKPTQEGIYQHYAYLASHMEGSLILYNVPGRTSSNILPETTLRLANTFPNIIGIKEASTELSQIVPVLSARPDGFLVLSGDDANTVALIAVGGDGVISVAGNAIPGIFSSMVKQALEGDFQAARTKLMLIYEQLELNFVEGNPAGVKMAMAIQNLCKKHVRLPLVDGSQTLRKALEKAMTPA